MYDPHFIEGLSVSADYWRLYLNNNITGIGAQSVVDLCSAGQLQYCPLIHRYASGINQGQFQFINEPTGNLGRVDVKGVDFAANYRLPEFSFGRFNVGVNATYLEQYDISTAPGTPANTVYHYAGHFMTFGSAQAAGCPGAGGGVCLFPRWRAQSSVGWQLGSIRRVVAHALHRPLPDGLAGSRRRTCSRPEPATTAATARCMAYVIKYGATVYNDIQFGYNLEAWNTRFDIGVNNLADKQPPFLFANNTLNANTDPSDFDLIGRYLLGSRHGQVLRRVFDNLEGPRGFPRGPFFWAAQAGPLPFVVQFRRCSS